MSKTFFYCEFDMSGKNVDNANIVKRLIKKKEKKDEDKSKSTKEIINQIPRKYRDEFKRKFGDHIPSRRDVDLFLREHGLTKK